MPAIANLKLLITLAQIDGAMAEREKNFIQNIGIANGLRQGQIESLLEQTHPIIVPESLSEKQKFDCIFGLVTLMKIDERMYREEILFCSRVASRLGYDPHVMYDLLLHVKSSGMGEDDINSLQQITRKYLN